MQVGNGAGGSPSNAVAWDMSDWWGFPGLHSRAYERLKSAIGSRAEVAVNLLEADRSIRMILGRTGQILKFARQLARGNLLGAASELRMASLPKGASTKHSFSRNYLEFHFGWSPLVQDIYSAVDHLQNPLKSTHLRVMVKDRGVVVPGSFVELDEPGNIHPFAHHSIQMHDWKGDPSVSMGMEVAINNPNLYLANSMGLVNPATIIWELIPYSFVVDWFLNVQQFLAQGTDFLGLTVMNPWTTRSVKAESTWKYTGEYHYFTWVFPEGQEAYQYRTDGSFHHEYKALLTWMVRSLGVSGPEFHVRPYKVWGWRRAASAVSLLTLQLKGR